MWLIHTGRNNLLLIQVHRLPGEDKCTKESTNEDTDDDIPIEVHGKQHDNVRNRKLRHMKQRAHSMLNKRRTIWCKYSLLSLDALDANITRDITLRRSSRDRSLLLRCSVLGSTRHRSDDVVFSTGERSIGVCVSAAVVGRLGGVFFASQGNVGDGLRSRRVGHVETSKTGSTNNERVVFSAQTAEELKTQDETDDSDA